MIVTFPRFGYTSEILSILFETLSIPSVIPSLNNQDVLKKGTEISPEEICLPFKYMAGNLLETYEAGADTVIMIATCGPCRLGEYGQLLKEVMDKAGCNYRWVILDSPSVIGMKEFIKRLESLIEGKKIEKKEIINNVFLTMKLIMEIDLLENKIKKMNGYTESPTVCIDLLNNIEEKLKTMSSFKEGFAYVKNIRQKINSVRLSRNADPVKVLITGEIYTSIEKDSNGKIEEKLMRLGCSVERHMNISWWIKNTFKNTAVPKCMNLAKNHHGLTCNIGGYGKETIDKIIASKYSDGIIKIMPSGCMPEIVTKAFCEKIQKDNDIRILHLIYDEMSGNAGYETRIEAFIDMLERRKNVLDGDRHWIHKHRSGFN